MISLIIQIALLTTCAAVILGVIDFIREYKKIRSKTIEIKESTRIELDKLLTIQDFLNKEFPPNPERAENK